MAPLVACTDAVAPNQAGISVNVKVAGSFPLDGFQIEVDGHANKLTAADKGLLIGGLSSGTHTVSLAGMPSGCVANGDTKLVVQTSGANQTEVEFRVSCFTTGAIAVVTLTGSDEPVSFEAFVDSDLQRTPIKGNSTTVLGESFTPGVHVVHLLGASPDCHPAGELSGSVNVRTGGLERDTAVARFTVDCGSPKPAITVTLVDSATLRSLPDIALPLITATPADGGAPVAVYPDRGSGTWFTPGPLTPGRWMLRISVIHAWTLVFPGLELYRDTAIAVDVSAGQTTVVPPVALRPRPLLLLVGINTCPFPRPDPPTMEDWDNCDDGYWGGAQVEIDVKGVEGTATAGAHFHATIGDGDYEWPAQSWTQTAWSAWFDIAILGDYDVALVGVKPSGRILWQLVPWEKSVSRVTVTHPVGYLGLDFWYH